MLRALDRLSRLPALLAGAASAIPTADGTVISTTFVIRGRGWGHGVGMGQWGAYGQAKRGVDYEKILAHYYPGTMLGEGAHRRRCACCSATGRGRSRSRPRRRSASRTATGEILRPRAWELPGRHRAQGRRSIRNSAARAPAVAPDLPARLGAAHARRPKPYRGALQVQRVGQRPPQVVDVVSDRRVHPWRRQRGGSGRLAARGRQGAGRRRALVRAVHAAATARRSTPTRAARCTAASMPSRSRRRAVAATQAAGPEVRRQDRDDVLLLLVRRADGERRRTSSRRPDPIPYLVVCPGPGRQVLAVPPLGAGRAARRRRCRALLGVPGATDLRTVPACGRARTIVVHRRRTGETSVRVGTFRRALDLRSTWITIGVLSLSRPAGSFAAGSPIDADRDRRTA